MVSVGYAQVSLQKGRSVKNKYLMEESGKTSMEAIAQIRTVSSLGKEMKFSKQYNDCLYPHFK